MVRTCEVALPLPLRTTFTYSVPEALDEATVDGARVVVPFRNRAMLGVVLGRGDSPDGASLKNVTEIIDPLPALSPRLIELARWISNYYLSPIGETLRAMLPPSIEVEFDREWQISEAGRARLRELRSLTAPNEAESADLAVLQELDSRGSIAPDRIFHKLSGGSAAATRLLRRGELIVRGSGRHRTARMKKIVAWRAPRAPAPARAAEQRIHRVLAETGGPIALASLLKAAHVSGSVVQRLVKEGKLVVSEEALTPEGARLSTGLLPPVNTLNTDQTRVVEAIRGRLQARAFHPALLHGVTGSGKTEVYLRAVEETFARGRTAIILVPEIALTLWISNICRARFGDTV